MTVTTEERQFRRALWVNHGCPNSSLYGDDGELQCNALECRMDFLRMPLADLCFSLMERGQFHISKVNDNSPMWTQINKER